MTQTHTFVMWLQVLLVSLVTHWPVSVPCHFLLSAIWWMHYIRLFWDMLYMWKRKEIKVSERTCSGWHPQIHFSLSICLRVWMTACQRRTTWNSDNCIHCHLVTQQKKRKIDSAICLQIPNSMPNFDPSASAPSSLTCLLIFFICRSIKNLFACVVVPRSPGAPLCESQSLGFSYFHLFQYDCKSVASLSSHYTQHTHSQEGGCFNQKCYITKPDTRTLFGVFD